MTLLLELKNQRVDEKLGDHGALILSFESGATLGIFNPVVRTKKGDGTWAVLDGQRLTDAFEDETELVLQFDDGSRIVVDLRDEAFVGPEAIVLRTPDGRIIVWN